MAETRLDAGIAGKVTASHSKDEPRHFLSTECDGLPGRIGELIGDKKVSWFAKECGFGESLLRKYLMGAQPNTSNLVAMANVGGVTLDWLATGRQPKTRTDLKAAMKPQGAGSLDTYRIAVEAIQAWQLEQNRYLQPGKLLEVLDLVVELADGKADQVKPLTAKVLRLAA